MKLFFKQEDTERRHDYRSRIQKNGRHRKRRKLYCCKIAIIKKYNADNARSEKTQEIFLISCVFLILPNKFHPFIAEWLIVTSKLRQPLF